MADNQLISVTVERYSPETDRESYQQVYQVPLAPGMSVLNVLNYIYENLDSGLGYYSSCDRGVCGRCTMTVNGRSALACTTLVQGDLTLAPLRGKALLRDLLVDL
jgi:succinate dehydrogenase/fumarate reductase iron-sulfur protein